MSPARLKPTYDQLVARLAVVEANLTAIRQGDADSIVVNTENGLQVYTRDGAEAFYRALVERMPEGAAVVRADGRILYANSRCAEMVGVPVEGLVGSYLAYCVEPSQRGTLLLALEVADDATSVDLTLVDPVGARTPVAFSVGLVDAAPIGLDGPRCVIMVDLSRRYAEQEAIREAEARFRGAFDNAPIGMALLDLAGRAEQVNSALGVIARRSADDMLGVDLSWLTDDRPALQRALNALLTSESEPITLAGRIEHVDGDCTRVAVRCTLVRGHNGQPLHFIVQVEDESARIMHEERLRHLADHDPLTGLLNRRAFELAVEQHLAIAARYGPPGALILIDVDNLKYINDTRGHQVGDQAIIQLAESLRRRLRASDVMARLGGDEFAVLIPQADGETARMIAEELAAAAREVVVRGFNDNRRVTISSGVVAITDPTWTPREIMALADLAMYDSKEAGRDRVTLYGGGLPISQPDGERLTWVGRIERAIEQGGLQIDAQPIVDMVTQQIAQYELLVRLDGPEGRLPAGRWFHIAERYDLAPAIDEWVLGRAFDLLAARPDLSFNVNVSAKSIGRASWMERVRTGLQETGVEASRLTFEITETVAIGNIDNAMRFTDSLRALGCRLAMDDFGAGFASFYYLKHVPFDDVKIDGEFVRDCVTNERDRAIIRAMVDVAASLGRRTVAECIEDEATLQLVAAHGIDLAQGFHLGMPEPAEWLMPGRSRQPSGRL
ncbi:EAL domain-containing protein [Jatrophihabitans sp.]|uniref:putative bifunctional diguanylate cyclase/phosphodiesterase n=1 Tax=Jatrophihabitans sp. TaxID=1932789 RepID=UPI0030C67C8E|nr:hypothetical protein [Jatrophihabitans sp.]